jgi:hypothetical protein
MYPWDTDRGRLLWLDGTCIDLEVHHDGSMWPYPPGPIMADGSYWTPRS